MSLLAMRSHSRMVHSRSILPAPRRRSMMLVMLKLTACRMCHSALSCEERQSSVTMRAAPRCARAAASALAAATEALPAHAECSVGDGVMPDGNSISGDNMQSGQWVGVEVIVCEN